MKKIKKAMYSCLGSLAMLVAVTSVAQSYAFCILILHQPEIPESLMKKMESK